MWIDLYSIGEYNKCITDNTKKVWFNILYGTNKVGVLLFMFLKTGK